MTRAVIRFSIYTRDDLDSELVANLIPTQPDAVRLKGTNVVLTNGKDTGRIRFESSWDYNITLESIHSAEDCLEIWYSEWIDHLEAVGVLINHGYKAILTIEAINTIGFFIGNKYMKILGDYSIDLSFDLYNEE